MSELAFLSCMTSIDTLLCHVGVICGSVPDVNYVHNRRAILVQGLIRSSRTRFKSDRMVPLLRSHVPGHESSRTRIGEVRERSGLALETTQRYRERLSMNICFISCLDLFLPSLPS